MPKENIPKFFNSKTIPKKNIKDIVSIQTGIKTLDSEIIGLNKGQLSIVSGLNGSGKSSVLSQIALEIVDAGKKIAMFSGELEAYMVMNWMMLQAAGKPNTIGSTKYPNYFYVRDTVVADIEEWLFQKLFLYNNDMGNKVDVVMEAIEECITIKKVDIVIIDNLMAMNLGAVGYDKFDKQGQFIYMLSKFAKEHYVHIILVAHPRKTVGFLRKADISGSADITNLADNVFIVHRVNEDFKRLSKQTFYWKEDHPIYQYSNVIEVCKNRNIGVQDLFVGLYYEKESKRFKNEPYEERHYGWEREITADREMKLPFDL